MPPVFQNRASFSLLALLTIAGLLFFTGLGSRALWDIDEGMHSAMAKEMVRTGDWVTPMLNGEPFLDKPALVNWLGAASITVFGRNEFAARLPGAIMGLGCVLLTFLLGRRMFDHKTGFLAGLILATSLLFLLHTRAVVYDVVLTFFTTLSLLSFYFGCEAEDPRKQRFSFLLFYVAVALAVLTKGPLGVVLPGMVIVPYIALTRRWRILRVMQLHWGTLIFLAIVVPWYVRMSQENPEFLSHFFLGQNVGYFTSPDSRHPRPVYYYVPVLLVALFPWGILVPQALVRAFGRVKQNQALLYLLLWTGVIFIFFSAAVSKLPLYLLPIFPAMAILLARLWRDLLDDVVHGPRQGMIWAILLLVAVLCFALFYYGLVRPPVEELTQRYGIPLSLAYTLFAIMALLLAAAAILLWRRRSAPAFAAVAAVNIVVLLFFVVFVAPRVDPYRSTKDLASTMDETIPSGQRLCFYQNLQDSTLFYTDRQALILKTAQQLEAYLESDSEARCVVEKRKLAGLGGLAERFQVEARQGNKLLVRLTEQRASRSGPPAGL
jgi:4-amino-4-deoxy-L-arabinose transferase-like glycosyltransferase